MRAPSPTAERREAMLGELAEWLHAAAHKTQRLLMESEDNDEVVRLGGSLTKLARGLRQCVLMHDRLEGQRLKAETAADEAAARAAAPPSEFVPRHLKRVRIRTAITRHVWRELDDDEGETDLFLDDLNARLDELEGEADFLDISIDELIARLCRDLGFDPPPLIPAKAGTQAESETVLPLHGSRLSPGGAELGVGAPNTS